VGVEGVDANGLRPGPGHCPPTQLSAVPAWGQHFQNCPRARLPKPNLVWPSGAAVQSTLLKGDQRLRQRDVGESLGSGGIRGRAQVCRRYRRRSRLRGLLWPQSRQGRVHIFTPKLPVASVRRCPRSLEGAAAPAHVLFLKEARAQAGPPGQKRGRELVLLG
jgi:hypothetical protein